MLSENLHSGSQQLGDWYCHLIRGTTLEEEQVVCAVQEKDEVSLGYVDIEIPYETFKWDVQQAAKYPGWDFKKAREKTGNHQQIIIKQEEWKNMSYER